VSETGKSPILRAPEVGAHSAAQGAEPAAVQRARVANGAPPAWGPPEVVVEVAVAGAGGGK
jgi:hypothetical protein